MEAFLYVILVNYYIPFFAIFMNNGRHEFNFFVADPYQTLHVGQFCIFLCDKMSDVALRLLLLQVFPSSRPSWSQP